MANPLLQWWHSLSVERQCEVASQWEGGTLDDLHVITDALERHGLTREEAEARALTHMLRETRVPRPAAVR